MMLDLSGDEHSARKFVLDRLPGYEVRPIRKAEIKRQSRRETLLAIKKLMPATLFIFTADLESQSSVRAMILFGAAAGAKKILVADRQGHIIERSRAAAFLREAPALLTEMLAGYVLLAPLSLVITLLLRVAIKVKPIVQSGRSTKTVAARSFLYIRAVPIASSAAMTASGGMVTHVAGFIEAAESLGYDLNFLASGIPGIDSEHSNLLAIPPSGTFKATRALYELWNNLVFTTGALKFLINGNLNGSKIGFIYQRYSRFNWTGVVLALATGLPLLLESNGSEVWVSRYWDPIDQVWLLSHFERLNLRAADIIFVVSDVARRGLLDEGIEASRIIVNPNGVDPDRFRPNCGGEEIRRLLGIDDRIVLGFTGTFGPWHGTEVLAGAAQLLDGQKRWHLLFIGDGDSRPATESIARAAEPKVTTSFLGKIPHSKVAQYLDACDILVSPHTPLPDGTEFFGSPTKVFEYLASGRPVIASDLGQIAEVIQNGENGLLVRPGDPSDLARAIERVAADKELAARLGWAGRKSMIERYTWRHNAQRVFDGYENIGKRV